MAQVESKIEIENSKIEKLIAQENDPEKRVFLLVLQQIKNSLVANTSLTQDVSEKLDSHIKTFTTHVADTAKMVNTGKGMWKIVAILGGVLQVIFIWIFSTVLDEFKVIHENAAHVTLELTKITAKQEILFRFYETQLNKNSNK